MGYNSSVYWIVDQKVRGSVLRKRYNQFKQVRPLLASANKIWRVEIHDGSKMIVELK